MSSVLTVRGLRIFIPTPSGEAPVVRGLDLDLASGECVGLAGESGSGKSLSALALMGLLPANLRFEAEHARFGDADLLSLRPRDWRHLRGAGMAMIFQDPATALDPVFRIGSQLREALRRAGQDSPRQAALASLAAVGFADPERAYRAYPHQFSGGMRQLAMIALADAIRPRVLFADEPTTALDVTTQRQVMARLSELSRSHGTAVLMISHDLRVLSHSVSRVYVMYAGSVVEQGPTAKLFRNPEHPYTAGLLAASPGLDDVPAPLRPIPGQAPSPGDFLSPCAFAPRCGRADDRCRSQAPAPAPAHGGAACHHPLAGGSST